VERLAEKFPEAKGFHAKTQRFAVDNCAFGASLLASRLVFQRKVLLAMPAQNAGENVLTCGAAKLK
jgi:hypothetical protein